VIDPWLRWLAASLQGNWFNSLQYGLYTVVFVGLIVFIAARAAGK
jgi:hypothetical protein